MNLFSKSMVVVACLLSLFISSSCVNKEKFTGIQLWSVKDDMKKDAKGTIEKLGAMGYDFVETAGYADGKFYGMEPEVFKKLCNDNGLEFVSSHTGKPAPNGKNKEKIMDWWAQCIDAHAKAGVQYIVQPFMGKVGYESLEGTQKYCDYFNEIGEMCNQKGIRFGYHNHDKEFTTIHDDQIVYDYLLAHTNPEQVMFQLDLFWIMKGEKKASDYFEKYPGRFELYHVKDEKELGASGTMDFKTPFEMAEKAGMEYYIVEVEKYSSTPLESVQASLDYLDQAEFVKQ